MIFVRYDALTWVLTDYRHTLTARKLKTLQTVMILNTLKPEYL